MKNKVINISCFIFKFILIFLSILFMYSLININLLQNIYLVTIFVLLFLIDLLFVINLSKKKSNTKKIVYSIFSLLFMIIYITGIMYLSNTSKFVNNITKEKYEYVSYSVIVKKDGQIHKIKELSNKPIGFLTRNTYLDKTKSNLASKSGITVLSKEYDDNAKIFTALSNDEVMGMVFESSYLDVIEESNKDLYSSIKEIYKFKVRVSKKRSVKRVGKTTEPFIIYISGSDSRGSLSDTSRSDVNIVAVVNPIKKKILLINIPRDYYVQLHNTTGSKDKLTHAGIYGVKMSEETINDLLSINSDYYVKVGFDTVIKSVDIVGGIDIYSDKNLTCHTNRSCVFTEGTQHVNGDCALAFSRERYSYTSGDRHRGENQQQVITKLIDKFTTPSILTKYNSILNALNNSFETDMSYDTLTNLIKVEAISFAKWDVESISLDGHGSSESTYSMGSQKLYVMIPDENTVSYAKIKIQEYLQK